MVRKEALLTKDVKLWNMSYFSLFHHMGLRVKTYVLSFGGKGPYIMR